MCVHWSAVGPPKRKTGGGRTTAKGTRPGEHQAARTAVRNPTVSATGVTASSRYTPPVPREMRESPRWLPVVMLAMLICGAIVIMLRYLVWTGSNVPTLIGLALILGGLWLATKWR
jgi:LPXTG-motif cell wall-anchored protein